MAQATAELIWVQSPLTELQVPHQTPTLLCDNLSAVLLVHNPILHSRTKHIELDIHFVREKIAAKSLIVKHVPASQQIADILTKPLGTSSFLLLRDKLRIRNLLELDRGVIEKIGKVNKSTQPVNKSTQQIQSATTSAADSASQNRIS